MRKSARLAVLGSVAWAAFALNALADDAAPPAQGEAERPPVTSISGSAPTETLQERMERFKREKGAGSDKPFEGFAAQAEAEMQRQRAEAIASGVDAGELEAEAAAATDTRIGARERLEDKLAALGAWGASGCTEIEPAWGAQEDFIRYRRLRADDFRSQKDRTGAAVSVSGASPHGFAAILISCELEPSVSQLEDGRFAARLVRARYYAVLSRQDSWLAEHREDAEAFLVGHQQLHFDMAEEFSRWLNAQRDSVIAGSVGYGKSPQLALGQLQLEWAKHMLAVREDFDAVETAFDRATQHGAGTEKQTEWSFKLGDGWEAFTADMRLETRGKPARR